MAIGPGVHPMAGRGSDMNHGAGLHTTTVAGFTTTTTGHGVRAVITTGTAVGGARLWWRLFQFIFHSETTSVGIPFLITSVIRIRRTNPAYLRAVTTLPTKELGGDNVRLRPANEELARRVMGSEPLRGDLPLR